MTSQRYSNHLEHILGESGDHPGRLGGLCSSRSRCVQEGIVGEQQRIDRLLQPPGREHLRLLLLLRIAGQQLRRLPPCWRPGKHLLLLLEGAVVAAADAAEVEKGGLITVRRRNRAQA